MCVLRRGLVTGTQVKRGGTGAAARWSLICKGCCLRCCGSIWNDFDAIGVHEWSTCKQRCGCSMMSCKRIGALSQKVSITNPILSFRDKIFSPSADLEQPTEQYMQTNLVKSYELEYRGRPCLCNVRCLEKGWHVYINVPQMVHLSLTSLDFAWPFSGVYFWHVLLQVIGHFITNVISDGHWVSKTAMFRRTLPWSLPSIFEPAIRKWN